MSTPEIPPSKLRINSETRTIEIVEDETVTLDDGSSIPLVIVKQGGQ